MWLVIVGFVFCCFELHYVIWTREGKHIGPILKTSFDTFTPLENTGYRLTFFPSY